MDAASGTAGVGGGQPAASGGDRDQSGAGGGDAGGEAGVADGPGAAGVSGDGAVGSTGSLVGPAGGSVESADGRVSLLISPGALSAELNIVIEPVGSVPAGALGTAYDIEPSGTQFAIPALLEVAYADAGSSIDSSTLRLATVVGGAWQPLASAIIPNHRLAALLEHLSPYAVVQGTDPESCECDPACFTTACKSVNGSVTGAGPTACGACTGDQKLNLSGFDFFWSIDDGYQQCSGTPYAAGYCTPCKRQCLRDSHGYIRHSSQNSCDMEFDGTAWDSGLRCVLACDDPVTWCGPTDDGAGGSSTSTGGASGSPGSGTSGSAGSAASGGVGGVDGIGGSSGTGGSAAGGATAGSGGSGGASPQSYFSVTLNQTNITVDCTLLDVDATSVDSGLVGIGYDDVGGISASTGQGFRIQVPLSAKRLRYSPISRDYPIATWTGAWSASDQANSTFSLSLQFVDSEQRLWTSCGPGSCGIPRVSPSNTQPDPGHYHRLDTVVQEAAAPGLAAFRLSGSFSALMISGTTPATATGKWSLRVVAPDPGPLDCFYGCVMSDGFTCFPGDANNQCGTNGDACRDCVTPVVGGPVVNGACLNQAIGPQGLGVRACSPCAPGAVTTTPCNGNCGTEQSTCTADGVHGQLSACSSGPSCGSACCPIGYLCQTCPVPSMVVCLPPGAPCPHP